jgi:hypothetical protein
MNSTISIESRIFVNNPIRTSIESWFIPLDILLIICAILAMIVAILFLFLIIVDKRCHTVPMMLIGNSCLSVFVFGSILVSIYIFTLENDLKQIQYQDSLCVFRAYFLCVSAALLNYSFFLQSIYRYMNVVYPNRLFWRSVRFEVLSICLKWIFALVYPIVFMFTDDIIYNVDNQVCQFPLRFSFAIIYVSLCAYIIPVLVIMFIYLKLVRYVHRMSKRVIPANTLSHAQRELKMVRRTMILITILIVVCFPYELFVLMAFFNSAPKYYFRIASVFFDASLLSIMIALFRFTDPLKISLMKIINVRPNVIVARMT